MTQKQIPSTTHKKHHHAACATLIRSQRNQNLEYNTKGAGEHDFHGGTSLGCEYNAITI